MSQTSKKNLKINKNGKSLASTLVSGGVGGLAVKIVNMLIQVVSSILVARCLGPSLLGVYTLLISVVQVFSILFQLGLPSYLVRYIASCRSTGDVRNLGGAVISALAVSVSASCFFITIVFFVLFAYLKANEISSGIYLTYFVLAAILVTVYSLMTIVSGADRGFGNIVRSQLPVQIIRPCLFLLLIAVVVDLFAAPSVENILLVNLISALIALCFSLFFIGNNAKFSWKIDTQISFIKYIKLGFPFLLLSSTQVISQHVDVLMLGLMTTERAVGTYKVSAQFTDILVMPLLAISLAIGPLVARLYSQGKTILLTNLVKACHQVSFLCLVPVAVMTAIFSNEILRFVYGEDFAIGSQSLVVFTIGKLLYSCVCFSGVVLSMIGRAGVASFIAASTLLLNILLNFIFIPIYDFTGAALATSISQVVVNVVGCLWMYKVLGFNVSAFGKPFSLRRLRNESV